MSHRPWHDRHVLLLCLGAWVAGSCSAQDPVYDGFSEQRQMEKDIRELLSAIDKGREDCFEGLKDSAIVEGRGWTANWKMRGSLGAAVLLNDTSLVYRTAAYADDPLDGFILMKNAGFYNRSVNGRAYVYQDFFEWEGSAQYRLVHSDDEYFIVEYLKEDGYVLIDFVLLRCGLKK